jgi:hypothetical protein
VNEQIGELTHSTRWPTVHPGEPLEVVAPDLFQKVPEGHYVCECRYGRLLVPDSHAVCHRCREEPHRCRCHGMPSGGAMGRGSLAGVG